MDLLDFVDVLWIDEIDKGFGSDGRSDGGTSQRVLATVLTWMAEKTSPVFVVATANGVERLPAELLRKGRFDEIFLLDMPARSERQSIMELQLRSVPRFRELEAFIEERIRARRENASEKDEDSKGFAA